MLSSRMSRLLRVSVQDWAPRWHVNLPRKDAASPCWRGPQIISNDYPPSFAATERKPSPFRWTSAKPNRLRRRSNASANDWDRLIFWLTMPVPAVLLVNLWWRLLQRALLAVGRSVFWV